jgi:hypothetical protein
VDLRWAKTLLVIPAKAGLSTAELVIQFCFFQGGIKMDSRFRGNDEQDLFVFLLPLQ